MTFNELFWHCHFPYVRQKMFLKSRHCFDFDVPFSSTRINCVTSAMCPALSDKTSSGEGDFIRGVGVTASPLDFVVFVCRPGRKDCRCKYSKRRRKINKSFSFLGWGLGFIAVRLKRTHENLMERRKWSMCLDGLSWVKTRAPPFGDVY